jgi:hypothetical protein
MSHLAFITLILFFAPLANANEVWKCQTDGKLVFSDVPCPSGGNPIERRKLHANVVQAEPVASSSSERSIQSERTAQNVCPTELDIRNLETSASSNTMGAAERTFLADEVRRARQCRKGQGNYTAEDWRAIRAAQEAQSSVSGKADARLRAEDIHSAADPIEGDRIARKRALAESDRRPTDTHHQRKF